MSGKSKFDWIYALAADPDVQPTHKFIGTYVALRNLEPGPVLTFKVRQTTIAANCAVSVDTIKRAFKALRHHGWIELAEQRQRGRGHTAADRYRLIMPPEKGGTSAPIQDEIGGTSAGNRWHTRTEIGGKPEAVNSENDNPIKVYKGLKKELAPGHHSDQAPAGNRPATPALTRQQEQPARLGPRPSRFCPAHQHNPAPGRCGACGQQRHAQDEWDNAIARLLADAMTAWKSAIDGCDDCDSDGWLKGEDGTTAEPAVLHHRQPRQEDFI